MSERGLSVVGLEKRYRAGESAVEVLRGISFEIGPEEGLAVTGPSGSGKSTLLHIVGTLEPPSAGRVTIDGRDPHGFSPRELAEFRNARVGFVFQDHHLLPQYTVLENVLVPTWAFPGRAEAGPERARTLLDRVGLGHRLDHRPAELSGGERQRVAVARALVRAPRLLLCDEPTGSLDGASARAVSDLLFELHGEARAMLVVVTHSLELAARFGRRLELREGRCSAA